MAIASSSPAQRAACAVAILLVAALALLLPGCDNPACVYGGNCFGGGGGGSLGENPATVPPNHSWLLPTAPVVNQFLPGPGEVASTTPIVVRFSESMSASSLSGGFELVASEGGFGASVPLSPPALLGDGRVLVLLPLTPLQPALSYELRVREDRVIYDLQGSTMALPADRVLGSFDVAEIDPPAPRVLTTWPLSGSVDQGTTGEVAVVFDRRVQAFSVTVDSFAVTVDGVTPAQNPAPQAAIFSGGGSFPTSDTRAWRWRSTDNQGQAISLGVSGAVRLSLSPAGNKILAEDGTPLAATLVDFDLAPFDPPLAAEIVSLPTDAIGIANLDGSVPLEVAVEIVGGQPTDLLGVFLFGTSTGANPELAAQYREVALSAVGYDPTVGVATLGVAELDLTSSTSPVTARFADGSLSVAVRVDRAGVRSAVRMLDTDRDDVAVQPALLDTTPPVLDGLGPSGTNLTSLRSNVSGLVVVGRASEPVRAAEVTSALGDNGLLPPVVAFDEPQETLDEGLFVAAPVDLGVIAPQDLPLPFTLRIYDRALNVAEVPTSASFRQLGASGPGAVLPGNPTVSVEVFDSSDLAPLSGARVFVHADTGGTPTLVDSVQTDVNGRATLLAAAGGATVLTVDADGYDLFTFQGVPTSRLGVPLARTAAASAIFQGLVLTTDTSVPDLVKWVFESRLADLSAGLLPVQACSFNPITLSFDCTFGPAPLPPGPLGAAALVAVDPPPNEFSYSAQGFLKGWLARLPRPSVQSGQQAGLDFQFNMRLDAASVPQEERALDGPAVDLDASGLASVDLANLATDPRVVVEARMRALPGSLLAGFGAAFDVAGTPTDMWRLRSAFPGAVDFTDTKYPGDELGELVRSGVIDPDLFLRVELVDTAGNASVRRPTFTSDPAAAPLVPVEVPTVVAPPAGGGTGGASFALDVTDVLDGSLAPTGLYRVTLLAANGRRWRLWAQDGAGATLRLWAPPIAAAGGTPLVAGPIVAVADVVTWPGLDVALFLWSDLPRELDVLASAAPITFSQP